MGTFLKNVVFEVFAPQKDPKSLKKKDVFEKPGQARFPPGPTRDFGVADPKTCRSLARKRLWRNHCNDLTT
jgi:hypothetical protein